MLKTYTSHTVSAPPQTGFRFKQYMADGEVVFRLVCSVGIQSKFLKSTSKLHSSYYDPKIQLTLLNASKPVSGSEKLNTKTVTSAGWT